jgi:3',5'-cyclic AMP phosphodiesterase CpdA
MDKPNKNLKNELIQMATGREIYWANGNHDHNMYIGGRKHYVVDKDDWRIVILKAGADKSISELKWLKKQLTDYKDKKVIVLEHQPIFRQGTTKILSRHKKIEKIYEQYSVDYVFSGHWHGDEWSRVVNGVTYRTLRGLTYGLGSYYYTIDFE